MRIPRKTLIGVGAAAAVAAGGTGVAVAVSGGGDGESDGPPVTGATATQAKDAALKVTGGGTVTALERDNENGATYEVEITKPDGSSVDVRLDDAFKLVGQPEADDQDRGEADDDRSDANDDRGDANDDRADDDRGEADDDRGDGHGETHDN